MRKYGRANTSNYADKDGYDLYPGARIKFFSSRRDTIMTGTVEAPNALGEMVSVQIDGDPFPTYVSTRQIELLDRKAKRMATSTKAPATRELRQRAKALNVEGWREMDREELAEAVAAAEGNGNPRSKAKKAPASRTASKPTASKTTKTKQVKAEVGEVGDNPFRVDSALYHITEELLKGGKRSDMVKRLRKKVELRPRSRGGKDYDEEAEIDYRIVRVCQMLANQYGYTVEKEGRGIEQKVKVIPS